MAASEGPAPPASAAQRRLRVSLLALGCLAVLLHGANLLYLARVHGCDALLLRCGGEEGAWRTGDFNTYRAVAEQIRERGLLGASYLRRTPGYPLALLAAQGLTGEVGPVRWLGPLLAGVAAAAIGWLAAHLSGRLGAAVFAGLLFCAWPGAYAISPSLRPDAPHAFLAAAALAATLHWRASRRARAAALAAALWAAVQLLRPTFFPLPLILPALLWTRDRTRRTAAISLALWASTLVVPLFVIGSNGVRHGVAVPSHVLAVNLACYAVPRLREELGEGEFHVLRRDCLAATMGMEARRRVPAQLARAAEAFGERPGAALASFLREIHAQMLHPLRPYDVEKRRTLYPAWTTAGQPALLAFWLCALGGWLGLVRRAPPLALFLALAAALVMLPAASSHLVGGRLRLPLDLFFLPVAATFFATAARALVRAVRRGAAPR